MQDDENTPALLTEAMIGLLKKVETGCLATVRADGSPYLTPLHFVYLDGSLCFHGSAQGQKMDNLRRDARAAFSACDPEAYRLYTGERACNTSAYYQSVLLAGRVEMLTAEDEKRRALQAFVEKYTPLLAAEELPADSVQKTAVYRLRIQEAGWKSRP